MSELAVTPRAVVTPLTGELVELDAPTDQLAEWLHRVRQAEADLRDAKRAVSLELLARMDKEARWTARIGGFEIKGDGPSAIDYDAQALYHALGELEEHDVISIDAMHEAVEIVHSYKAKVRGINALRKLGGRVTEAIDACATPAVRERRVTVRELPR